MAVTVTQPRSPNRRKGVNDDVARAVRKLRMPNVPLGVFSWPSYVIPRSLAAEYLIAEVIPRAIAKAPPLLTNTASNLDSPDGWRDWLSNRASELGDTTPEAAYRRLYQVLHGTTGHIVYTENMERWLIAVGLDLDRDSGLPVMPGDRWNALDLLYLRAKALDPKTRKIDVVPLIPDLLALCWAIIETPKLVTQLQDDAPFNCLRPWS